MFSHSLGRLFTFWMILFEVQNLLVLVVYESAWDAITKSHRLAGLNVSFLWVLEVENLSSGRQHGHVLFLPHITPSGFSSEQRERKLCRLSCFLIKDNNDSAMPSSKFNYLPKVPISKIHHSGGQGCNKNLGGHSSGHSRGCPVYLFCLGFLELFLSYPRTQCLIQDYGFIPMAFSTSLLILRYFGFFGL